MTSAGMLRVLVVAVLACVPLSGCSSDPGCSDGPGIANTLASADRWVRVTSVEGLSDAQGTRLALLTVAGVTPNAEGAPAEERIWIHSSFTDTVTDRLNTGFDVFLALRTRGVRDEVVFVVARNAQGEHFLPGFTCGQESFLRERLGTEYNSVLASIIGVTSPRRVLAILKDHGVGA